MGLEFGVEHHRFESSVHSMLPADQARLLATVTERAGSEPSFWGNYTRSAAAVGGRLIDTVRSASALGEEPPNGQDLLERLGAVTGAMREMAPFVVATPTVLGLLTSVLASTVAEQASGPSPEEVASEILPRLLTPWAEPDPVAEMRNGYRIALEVASDAQASELFLGAAPRIALSRVEEEFPGLHQMISDHVEAYGWLRSRGYRHDPLSPENLIYRVQLVLARWPFEAILQAAHPTPFPDLGQVLGSAPSQTMGSRVADAQAMVTQRCFQVDAHLQAECIARPLLSSIAEVLGCTIKQLMFSSADEIVAGLDHQVELPLGEIDMRARNGFSVQRDLEELVVHSDNPPTDRLAAGNGVLKGMTGCRGTAVGRVRIILDQSDLLSLEIGDVLVTAASTIDPTDMTGTGTVFPTRSGGPYDDALDRAVAVVADEGGLLSHGAIVCRERGLPCVLGTDTATTTLVDGQIIEVDATKPIGMVIRLLPFG